MATVQKRGNSYKIIVSCGYDMTGKQLRQHITWTPELGMTERQIEKELERQKVLFEERAKAGTVQDGGFVFKFLPRNGWRTTAASSSNERHIPSTKKDSCESIKHLDIFGSGI